MFQKHQSGLRLLRAAGISLALIGFASQPAVAQQAPLESTEALTVVRDAETGQLRHASASEMNALKAQSTRALARMAPKATQQKTHGSGARGARLTDEFMSTSVAVRNPDGSIGMQCFDSHGAASDAASSGHVHTITPVTE